MAKKTAMRGVRFQVFFLLVGLVGLSLILSGTSSYGQAQKALIDLNSASEKELESIKGIGPAMAKKIIDGRPYKSVDELSKTGIPAKTIEAMKPLVKVGSSAQSTAPASPAKPAAPQKASAKDAAAKAEPSAPALGPPEGDRSGSHGGEDSSKSRCHDGGQTRSRPEDQHQQGDQGTTGGPS